jgi:murein DD-endopeptidase MepM/ murein hydrolase activator NlpD
VLKTSLFFIMFVLFCARVEADFILAPETLSPGGVALLCWQGSETPHDLLQVTFSGTAQPLLRRDNRPCALVGVDLDQTPGLWPLTVESVTLSGTRHRSELSLRIEGIERPAQKLTLPKQMVTPTKTKIVQQIEKDRKRLDQVFKRRQPVHFSPPFLRPVEGEVISAFGLRRILNGIPKSPHNGVDFRGAAGTQVKAMARGEVALADNLYYTGKTVILDHGGGLFSLYAHLESLAVTPGEMVVTGKKIGTIGSTGRSTGPHLHMGTRLGKARIDPLALLALFADEKR